jgi:hypothetical protein
MFKMVRWDDDDSDIFRDPLRMCITDLTSSQLVSVYAHLITKEWLDGIIENWHVRYVTGYFSKFVLSNFLNLAIPS